MDNGFPPLGLDFPPMRGGRERGFPYSHSDTAPRYSSLDKQECFGSPGNVSTTISEPKHDEMKLLRW